MRYAQVLIAQSRLCLAEISGERLIDIALARFAALAKIAQPTTSIFLAESSMVEEVARDGLVIQQSSWEPEALAFALQNQLQGLDCVVIHDCQRPLTSFEQFQRTWSALTTDIDAVRPTGPFVETIKSIKDEGFTDQTIDREKIRRIGTPEIIRVNAIEFDQSKPSILGWFLPLREGSQLASVELEPQSSRANSQEDIELLEILSGEIASR